MENVTLYHRDFNEAARIASLMAKHCWDGKAYVYMHMDTYYIRRYETEVTGARLVAEIEERVAFDPVRRYDDHSIPHGEQVYGVRAPEIGYAADAITEACESGLRYSA